jgi:hypothetical protein
MVRLRFDRLKIRVCFGSRSNFRFRLRGRGKPVRFVVDGKASASGHFFGLANPVALSPVRSALEAPMLLARTLVSWFFLFLPGVFLAITLLRKGSGDLFLLACAVLAGVGAWGYLSFWLWFASPALGRRAGVLLSAVAIVWIALSVRRLDGGGRSLLRKLLVPAALAGAEALLVLAMGFCTVVSTAPSIQRRRGFRIRCRRTISCLICSPRDWHKGA